MEQEQESELNLGRYVAILRKWYRLILLATLLAGATALVVGFATPPTYEVETAVATVKSGTQINFDTKIKTISEMDTAQVADQAARRKSLTTIAKSPDVASGVIAKLGNRLTKDEQVLANLVGAVDAINDGDLIKIKASTKRR